MWLKPRDFTRRQLSEATWCLEVVSMDICRIGYLRNGADHHGHVVDSPCIESGLDKSLGGE